MLYDADKVLDWACGVGESRSKCASHFAMIVKEYLCVVPRLFCGGCVGLYRPCSLVHDLLGSKEQAQLGES